jgi:hypothetical protein
MTLGRSTEFHKTQAIMSSGLLKNILPPILYNQPAVETEAWNKDAEFLLNQVCWQHGLVEEIEGSGDLECDWYDLDHYKYMCKKRVALWCYLIGHCDTVCVETNEMSLAVAAYKAMTNKKRLEDVYDSEKCVNNDTIIYIAELGIMMTRWIQYLEKTKIVNSFGPFPYEMFPMLDSGSFNTLMEDVEFVCTLLTCKKFESCW